MRSQSSKVAVLFLALVVCFAGFTVGFGHWENNLYINGSVTTSPFTPCVEFIEWTTKDPCGGICYDWTVGDVPLRQAVNADWRQLDKDVGCTWVEFFDTDPEWCGPELAVVSLYNTYPCYATKISLVIGNSGDVPVELMQVVITPLNFTIYDPDTNPDGEVDLVLYGFRVGDVLWPWTPTDPGASREVGELDIHVRQPAEQGVVYQFLITITAEQYLGP